MTFVAGAPAIRRLFIANRGEIAIRIARAASELGIVAVAAYAADDTRALHVERADEAVALSGEGVRAYLDIGGMIAAAIAAECDAVHPGYGFLSENAAFARASAEAGLVFVGPSPETLERFGDKARARTLAKRLGVPVIEGTDRATSLEEAEAFLAALGPGAAVMLKAVSGGGGRGMRVVDDPAKLKDAYSRCRSEALTAFGSGELYVERLIRRARHVEVQVIGDGRSVAALGDRECTLQRRNQKLIEIAPAPSLDEAVRARIAEAALELAREAKLDEPLHVRIPDRQGCALAGSIRVHRGQSAAPGRTYRHRRGHGARSRSGADPRSPAERGSSRSGSNPARPSGRAAWP